MTSLRRFFRDLPVGSKLASLASILIIIIVLVLTFLSIRREQISFRSELESQATLLLETLPLTMRDPLYRVEVDELLDIVRVIGDNDDVTFMQVYDSQGAILVDAESREAVYGQTPDDLGADLLKLNRDVIYLDWQSDQLLAGRAIILGNQSIGAVAIGLSTDALNQKIAALTLQSLLLAGLGLVLTVGLTFPLSRQITRPLRDLTDLSAKMAGGDLETRADIPSKDEIGQLGTAFNQMGDAIQKREKDLRDLAASLEATVNERTAELQKQNKELEVARKDAEEATRLKSEFLATMSHELRTPLNAVMGFSQLLLAGASGTLNEKQQDKIQRILKNSQMLLELINDVLDLAKIEAGRIELVERPFRLEDWLKETTRQLESLAQEKRIGFEVKFDSDLPNTLVADSIRLKQIAVNLMSNAIKFTDEGKVSIELKKLPDNEWSIVVTDTGVGIPSHAQEYIFDEFRQIDGSSQRKYSGTGLGLAIVRNLVVMMKGSIQVESAVGEGSIFTVKLPLTLKETEGSAENAW